MAIHRFKKYSIILAILTVFIILVPINQLVEVEVIRVIDGDTFVTSQLGSIRLADASTPEIGQAGGDEAKILLTSLLTNKRVYVNIDDLYKKDTTGNRLVCVVYVQQGSGLINVNKALLDSGLAVSDDHMNEFHPSLWAYYWPISFLPETYFIETILSVVLIGISYFIMKRSWSSF